jgi:hypothetical protein
VTLTAHFQVKLNDLAVPATTIQLSALFHRDAFFVRFNSGLASFLSSGVHGYLPQSKH